MGSSSSRHNADEPSTSSSASHRLWMFALSCLRFHHDDDDSQVADYQSSDNICNNSSGDQIILHDDHLKDQCCGKVRSGKTDEIVSKAPSTEINEWGQLNLSDTASRVGSSSQSLSPSNTFLSRCSFFGGDSSFRLSKAPCTRIFSAISAPSSCSFSASDEEDPNLAKSSTHGSVSRTKSSQGRDLLPSCIINSCLSPQCEGRDLGFLDSNSTAPSCVINSCLSFQCEDRDLGCLHSNSTSCVINSCLSSQCEDRDLGCLHSNSTASRFSSNLQDDRIVSTENVLREGNNHREQCNANSQTLSNFGDLPTEIWIEIFTRMSVKPLLQATCVCKRWHGVIKDPYFKHIHLEFQKLTSKDKGHLLLQQQHQIDHVINFFLFDGESIPSAESTYQNLFHYSDDELYERFDIDGPVNGLYCLHNERGRIVIWNPATGEVGFLPFPENYLPSDGSDMERGLREGVVGLGTDPIDEEDFKVILISYCFNSMDDREVVYSMLYTTKTNTWRLVMNELVENPCFLSSLNSTYSNGLYYWKVGQRCTSTALVFDMREEAFRKIPTPCHGDLALHNDHIYLFAINDYLSEIDIWMMLEEGNWLKKISIKGFQWRVPKRLGFWKTENVILIVFADLDISRPLHYAQPVLYDIASQESTILGPRGFSGDFKALVYYESLVHLSGEIDKYKADNRASLFDTLSNFLRS